MGLNFNGSGGIFSGAFLIGIAYQSLTDLLAFAVLGILAIIAAITYTVGAKPYGYLGLGDLSVLLFFWTIRCRWNLLSTNSQH